MDWKRLLAYVTGSVDEELLLRNEYLVRENRALRTQVTERLLAAPARQAIEQVLEEDRRRSRPAGRRSLPRRPPTKCI